MPAHATDTVLDSLLERRLVPDAGLRAAARTVCRHRLWAEHRGGSAARLARENELLVELSSGPLAEVTGAANDQHYEVPPAFFQAVLGPRLKYSCCWWDETTPDLAAAEEAMLSLTAARAGIEDGMQVLELGCGWGSLTLWLLEQFPDLSVEAVSNSAPQRRFIEARATERGVADRLQVRTCDINDLTLDGRYDRVVSIEMFEHLRNYRELLARIAGWLAPDGRLFTHVFSHRDAAYRYRSGWMARNFFSGGTMPSHELFERFDDHLRTEQRWVVSGTHYARTARAWLDNLDAHRDDALAALRPTEDAPGAPGSARRQLGRWRLFFIACEELWGYRGGSEWQVSHHLLAPVR